MKILWATIDRSKRAAFKIFTTLQEEVNKIADIDFIRRDAPADVGSFCKSVVTNKKKLPAMINVKKANQYDLIFTDSIFAFMSEDWKNIKVPKAVLIEDQHGPTVKNYAHAAYHRFNFDIFCVRYKNPVNKFHSYFNDRHVIWVPHCIDENMFKDYGLGKDVGVLSVGSTGGTVYPIRNKVHGALNKKPFYKRVKRPNEKKGGELWPIGVDYAKLINSAKLTVSCTSTYNYVVLKFFEIPGAKSALYSDFIPEMKELGFEPGINFFKVNPNNILNRTKNLLKNPRLEEVTQNGYDLIHSRHTGKVRAQEFMNKIEDYLRRR